MTEQPRPRSHGSDPEGEHPEPDEGGHPPATVGKTVKEGHWHSLSLLEQVAAVHSTRDLYRQVDGREIYLRPTDSGLTVLPLDPEAPKFVGAGHLGSLPPTEEKVTRNWADYERKLSTARQKPEERFSLRLVGSALADGLRLPDSDLLFLTQEWRFPTWAGGKRLDILAVEPDTGRLVIIELKQRLADIVGAADQCRHYVRLLTTALPELGPFLGRLFSAMRGLYADEGREGDVLVDLTLPPRAEVWSPQGRIRV